MFTALSDQLVLKTGHVTLYVITSFSFVVVVGLVVVLSVAVALVPSIELLKFKSRMEELRTPEFTVDDSNVWPKSNLDDFFANLDLFNLPTIDPDKCAMVEVDDEPQQDEAEVDQKKAKRDKLRLLLQSTITKEAVRRAAHRCDKRLGKQRKSAATLRKALEEYLRRVLVNAVPTDGSNILRTNATLKAVEREEEERRGKGKVTTFYRLFGRRKAKASDEQLMAWEDDDEAEEELEADDSQSSEGGEDQDDEEETVEEPGPSTSA